EDATHVVCYQGVLQEALRDLAAWVEKDIPPPASTGYKIDDGQVVIPATATQRLGIQPVVTLKANDHVRADIGAGQSVTFTGTITVPPGAGSVIAAQWDFDGTGVFATSSSVPRRRATVTVTITHRFDRPGTYFPALRGISQRQ